MLDYLFTRGGVHVHTYALARERLTGVVTNKVLPTPKIEGAKISESHPFMAEGTRCRLYCFSPDDHKGN